MLSTAPVGGCRLPLALFAASPVRLPMNKYEYKIFSGMSKMTKAGRLIDWSATEKTVNELIAAGWEVVSSNASPCGLLVFGCGSQGGRHDRRRG